MEDIYGQVFRKIRINQKLTLREVAQDIVSISYLAKFETGQTNITLTIFLKLLSRINVKIEEFLYYCGDSTSDVFDRFVLEFSKHYRNNDIRELIKLKEHEEYLYSLTGIKLHKINGIMIAAAVLDIDSSYLIPKEDFILISEYLFQIPYWSEYNLFVLSTTHAIIPNYLLQTLISEIKKQKNSNLISYTNVRPMIFLFHHVSITFLRNNDVKSAIESHKYALNMLETGFFFEKNRSIFIDGLIKISLGNTYEGIQNANKAINTLQLLEPSLVKKYTSELKRHLENLK